MKYLRLTTTHYGDRSGLNTETYGSRKCQHNPWKKGKKVVVSK